MNRLNDLEFDVDDKVTLALHTIYTEEILASWDWEALPQKCRDNYDSSVEKYGAESWDGEEDFSPYSEFIGSCFALAPSGKYYTPFANSNVDRWDVLQDAAWYDALDDVAEGHGLYITSGEGDPCDIFVVLIREESQ